MTRTKASVKRRQQRSRLEREAREAQLREVTKAEQQQRAQAEEEEEEEEVAAAPQQYAENQEEQAEREEDRALVEEPIRENAREAAEEEEGQQQESALAEQPIKAQEDNAHEQEEGGGEEEGHEEGKGGEEEEEDGNGDGDEGQLLLTDYEKQRKRRLKENAAKLAALNLPSLASSFGPSTRPQRQSSKKKSKKDDDYMPSSSSDSEDSDSDDNNEEGAGPRSQQDVDGDYNEDEALQEAISLSLTATADNVIGTRSKVSQTRKGKRQVSDRNNSAKKRRKGPQEQFTIDEIAAIFSLIDEQGNGKFSVAEVERIASSHDFTWSKQEISDMIDIFDSNKDGQLDLSEFQGIFGRMNMLKMHVA